MSPRLADDRGAGLIGTIGGVTVVLAFLLFAVQLLVGLYANTTVTAIATDTAQRVADADAARSDAALEVYRQDAERSLDGVDGQVDFDESIRGASGEVEIVVVHVTATAPRFIPPFLPHDLGVRHIEERVRMEVEQFQDEAP